MGGVREGDGVEATQEGPEPALMPLPVDPSQEEREALISSEELASLSQHPGWIRFNGSVLELLCHNYENYLAGAEGDLVRLQAEARTLWFVLGSCEREISRGKQTQQLLQARHEAAVHEERASSRYSEAFLRMRGVRGASRGG